MGDQIDGYYDEILKVVVELQNDFQFIDKTDQKAIVKLDRKARNIESAIHEYELSINNNVDQYQEKQDHQQKLLDLKNRYLVIMDQVHQDPTLSKNMTKSTAFKPQSRFNNHAQPSQPNQPQGFVPILQELNSNGQQDLNGSYVHMGPQDVNVNFNNTNGQNPYIQSHIQQPKQISMQPMQPQSPMNISNNQMQQQQQGMISLPITHQAVPMQQTVMQSHQMVQQPQQQFQQEVMMTQDYQDYNIQTTQGNFIQQNDHNKGKINRHMNNILGGNFIGRKCAVRDCFFQTEYQCQKCRVWVCKGHHYEKKDKELRNNNLKKQVKQKYYCRDCGYKQNQKYKGYYWVVLCCLCSSITVGILVILMTYLDFI